MPVRLPVRMRDAAGPIPSTTTYNRGRRPITSDHGGPTHVTSTTLAAARNNTPRPMHGSVNSILDNCTALDRILRHCTHTPAAALCPATAERWVQIKGSYYPESPTRSISTYDGDRAAGEPVWPTRTRRRDWLPFCTTRVLLRACVRRNMGVTN